MVDSALVEQVMRLDAAARLELRDAIDESLGDEVVAPEIWELLEQRVAEPDANPDDYVSLDDDEREVRARRRVG